MKTMRKKWAILLAAAMLAGLTACGNSGAPAEEKKEETKEETVDKEEKADEPASDEVSIEEAVLVEWEGLKITAKSMQKNEYNKSPEIKLLIENGTSYGITLEATGLYVNGCYQDNTDYGVSLGDIPAGKKANAVLSLENIGSGTLEKVGIEEVGMVEVEFTVRDSSKDYYDDNSVIYTSDLIEIQTSAYDSMDTAAIAEGKELYNQNGIRIVAKELSAYTEANYGLYIYVENSTDKDIVVDSYDVSVDGFVPEESYGLNAWLIPAGRYSVNALVNSYDETVPDETAMKEIKEMQFGVKVYDEANWSYGYDDTGLLVDTGVLTYAQ